MDDVPIGFAMSLAQNEEALSFFGNLDDETKRRLIQNAHHIGSKEEMRAYVAHLRDYVFPE